MSNSMDSMISINTTDDDDDDVMTEGGGGSSSSNGIDYRTQLMIRQKDIEISSLRSRVESLSQQLQASLQASSASSEKRRIPLMPHAITVREVHAGERRGSSINSLQFSTSSLNMSASDFGNSSSTTTTTATLMNHSDTNSRRCNGNNRTVLTSKRERIGRTASLATRNILEKLSQQAATHAEKHHPPAITRILEMFLSPTQHMDYLNSLQFAKDLIKLCSKVRILFENEPRCIFIQSPVYVFGDIHGNLEDLHFFSDNIWRLGMNLTAGNFLFLGDYVDRGLSCLETVAYLFAMKQQLPKKVFLLRGNHETRDVNGWEEHYGERSFIWQCRNRFGDELGYKIWESCNAVFDRLPLAAIIDQDIFCVHGGIPRPISTHTTRIQDILSIHKIAGINPPYEHEDDIYQQVASDCIWSDPASEIQELSSINQDTGYGESLRGGGAICFGHKAVHDFLQQHDLSYIMRAHEAHAEGVAISKGARVFTVFSTSKDHNQGNAAMAGCILVDNDKLQVINRSPAYKNQYVHRRDSISLANLSENDIRKRIQLGLITPVDDGDDVNINILDFEDDDDDNDSNVDAEDEAAAAAAAAVAVAQLEAEGGHVGNDGDDAFGDDDDDDDEWEDFDEDIDAVAAGGSVASGNNSVGGGSKGGGGGGGGSVVGCSSPANNNNNKHDSPSSLEKSALKRNSSIGSSCSADGSELVFSRRRLSVDLSTMSQNSHDDYTPTTTTTFSFSSSTPSSAAAAAQAVAEWDNSIGNHGHHGLSDFESNNNKRHRSKRPSVAAIAEAVQERDGTGHDDEEDDDVDDDNDNNDNANDDDEIETVVADNDDDGGCDHDVELHDA